jgi:hypothetical protein
MLLILAFGYYHATMSKPKPKDKAKNTYLGDKPKSKSHK